MGPCMVRGAWRDLHVVLKVRRSSPAVARSLAATANP